MKRPESGYTLVMVIIFLGLGALLITPTLSLAYTTLGAKQIHSDIVKEQYTRDGTAEYAIWELIYGTAVS